MIYNMVTGGKRIVYVYGTPNEVITLTGDETIELTLDDAGCGVTSLSYGYWNANGGGETSKVYPDGFITKITATNNKIHLMPVSTSYWYGLVGMDGSWIHYDQDTYHSNKWKVTGNNEDGWSIMVHSNSHSVYWARVVPSTAFSILKADGSKYTKCRIMASGYCHTYPNMIQGANEYDWYYPYCKSYVGVINPATGETFGEIEINGTKLVTTIDISSVSGDTVLPYIKSEEKGDTTGSSPGNMNPTTTVYAVWFE